jgi:thioester reductase-like protein
LTGGNGSLGTFLISQLSQLPSNIITKIICLIRASDNEGALEKVVKELKSRGMDVDSGRIEVVASDLSDEKLGLGDEVYERVGNEVDVIVHVSCLGSNADF